MKQQNESECCQKHSPEQQDEFDSEQQRRGNVAATLRRHIAPALINGMTPNQRRVTGQLTGCRTGRYGSRSHYCKPCDHGQITLNSCGNRHCTRCGDGRRSGWKERMAKIALPVPYLHEVFTIPHELNDLHDLSEANTRAMIQLIFDSGIATTKRVFERRFGIGMVALVMVLHTWGQRMLRHVHTHVLLVAGGISIDGQRWIQLDLDNASLEALKRELASEFRKTYLRRLRGRIKSGKIQMCGDGSLASADKLIARLEGKNWMIDLQGSPQRWEGGPQGIINYLSSYVSGSAISDYRLQEDDGQDVTISYKDYRRDSLKCSERMPGWEFVLRFISHYLPPHCRRIRCAGLYAPQGRAEKLERACRLIAEANGGVLPSVNGQATVAVGDEEQPAESRESLFTGEGNERKTFPATCNRCKQFMDLGAMFDPQTTLRILPYLVAVMQWLAGKLPAPPKKRPFAVPAHLVLMIRQEQRAESRRLKTEQADNNLGQLIRGSPEAE